MSIYTKIIGRKSEFLEGEILIFQNFCKLQHFNPKLMNQTFSKKKELFFFLLSNYSVWRHSNVISRKKLSVARGFSLAFQLIFSTLANKQVCWQWRQFHQRHCRYLLNHKIVVIDRISIQWQYILWLVRGRYNVRLLSIFLEPLTWIFKHL